MKIVEPFRFHYLALKGILEQGLRLIHDDIDVMSMCKLQERRLRDTIILYVKSGHAPLAVEVLEGLVTGLVEGLLKGVKLVWGYKRSLIG